MNEIGERPPQKSFEFKNRHTHGVGGYGHTKEDLSNLLDKLRGKKKQKSDTGGVKPGRSPSRTSEDDTRNPSGKIKPHKLGE